MDKDAQELVESARAGDPDDLEFVLMILLEHLLGVDLKLNPKNDPPSWIDLRTRPAKFQRTKL